MCGDRNNAPVNRLLDTYPDLVNIVTTPILGNQILDIILTDTHSYYDKALVLPPVQPDRVGFGAPIDHSVAVAHPNLDKSI